MMTGALAYFTGTPFYCFSMPICFLHSIFFFRFTTFSILTVFRMTFSQPLPMYPTENVYLIQNIGAK